MTSDGDEARLDLKHGRNPLVYKSQTEGFFDVKKGAKCLYKIVAYVVKYTIHV